MATSRPRVAWGPTLACVLSASVLVAAVSSSLVNLRGTEVALASAAAGAAPAVSVELAGGAVSTSWSADGRPAFLDLSRPADSRWTLAVVPTGPSASGAAQGTVTVAACPEPWRVDGTCAGTSRELVAAAPIDRLLTAMPLELGASAVAHLRVTLTSAASLLLSPA